MRSPSLAVAALAALLSFVAPVHGQRSQPAAGAGFALAELQKQLEESGRAYLPFLNRRSLSCGIYRLRAGADDGQQPHSRDEVYYVISGRAKLEVEDDTHDASTGAVLFVAAGAKHRFVDIEEDLTTLVFFSESRPTQGGMAAGPKPSEQTPYDEASERGSTRVFYWFEDSSAGQLEIVYGRPDWKAAYDAFLKRPSGKRWRFGENFWTTLDTNIPLTIGGAELEVGQYYLVLQHDAKRGLRALALDPQEVRKQRLDAYEANETTGGIAVPLTRQEGRGNARRLTIDLTVDRDRDDHATLTVRFGPHVLTAPVVMKPPTD